MKFKDPVTAVKYLVIILGITIVILPIISIFEKRKAPGWICGVVLLFCSMFVVYGVIKNMAKRIDELENKLEVSESEAS